MQKRDFTYPSADGKTKIHAIEWKPDGAPLAVLQICHGMVEYIDRYDAFASFLAGEGFLVVGNDHLGHGASVTSDDEHGFFGHPDGNKYVIADINELRSITSGKCSDVPYFMMGHSMGSFLLRQYITVYAEGLSGGIIMGTGSQPESTLTLGRVICRLIAIFRGWHYRSAFVDNMALGSYNKRIESPRTGNDWLTQDEKVVDAYCADPWCTFMFTVNGYFQMFKGISIAQKDAGKVPKDLPLLVVSGKEDPVGGFGKNVRQVYENYKKLGSKDITLKLWAEDRHEILNAPDKDAVYADILSWLKERMPG